MFSRRLAAAFALLALLSFLQGSLAWWVTHAAEQRGQRGRVAGDVLNGFLELAASKQVLRAWSLQVLLGVPYIPGQQALLGRSMLDGVERLQVLSVQAQALDRLADMERPERA